MTGAVFDPRGLHCSSKWQHGKNRLCGNDGRTASDTPLPERTAGPQPLTWVQNKIYAAYTL